MFLGQVLAICGVIARLQDTTQVVKALKQSADRVKASVDKLQEMEHSVKDIDEILQEMTTPIPGCIHE